MSCVLKTTFDSATNHLNLSPMFLNCLLLDLTVIDLISIVHLDTIWVEIAKIFEMRTSGGRGGVFSDFGHPRTRGGGGVKKGQIFADVLYGWPLINIINRSGPKTEPCGTPLITSSNLLSFPP